MGLDFKKTRLNSYNSNPISIQNGFSSDIVQPSCNISAYFHIWHQLQIWCNLMERERIRDVIDTLIYFLVKYLISVSFLIFYNDQFVEKILCSQ